MRRLAAGVLCLAWLSLAQAQEVTVTNSATLRQAVRAAQPGARILLAPGDYPGGVYLENIHGTAAAPIVIGAADPAQPPRFVGGTEALHLSDVSYLELHNLVITGQTGNGLNLDDGGSFDTPAHHVTLANLVVLDIGPTGNHDGIKLSGLDDFVIRDCQLERWGDGGSGVDMVGCHRGLIEGCHFQAREGGGSNAIQSKGGTRDLVIRGNRFDNAGARAINIGGSTGLRFFRPQVGDLPVEGFEAKDITVEGNVFIGSQAPLAFVGVDGAVVRFNTIVMPTKWALRILQETVLPEFVPCRKGVFTDNIIVFRSDWWGEGGCNIGPNTAPETFRFARNVWFCQDRPDRSRPTLPTAEEDGVYGADPQFVDADNGDYTLKPGSPAAGHGHTALPAAGAVL